MIGFFDRLSRPLMRALDPEDAHALGDQGLALHAAGAAGRRRPRTGACAPSGSISPIRSALPPASTRTRRFRTRCCGWASALSRSARSPRCRRPAIRARACSGSNPTRASINRLGFNNAGAAAVLKRLAARANEGGIVGVNIGANRDSADRVGDYVRLIETFAAVASYFTVNVSSPNTPGLRDLQQAKALDDLLARVRRCARAGAPARRADAGAGQDRARSHAVRSRRRGRHRAQAPPRRHDRRQHHDRAAGRAARARQGQGGGRAVRPAAVQAVDPHAGGDLRARRGRVPADRRRRHRLRPDRHRQDQGRRDAAAALHRAGVSAASAWWRRSRPTCWRRSSAATATRWRRWSASDAADITAESWPS